MRNGSSGRRSRGRGNNRRNNQKTQVYDSNGPDVRIRGTAHQVCEKYLALAKDAGGAGDYILAESYMQHAEHYQRIINSWSQELDNAKKNRGETVRKDSVKQDKAAVQDDLGLPESITGGKEGSKEEAEKELADA